LGRERDHFYFVIEEHRMSDKPKAATKTEVYAALAEKTGMSKKEIAGFMDTLSEYIKTQIGKKGPGIFVLPGLLKVIRHKKPARPARMGIDPRTREQRQYPAKPASIVVKVRALKSLKETVADMKAGK
jgi:nucleoid DNA-binding protein